MKRLRQRSEVKAADLNYVVKTSALPNDDSYSDQRWHSEMITLPQAWRVALPGLGNLFQVLLKDTALISVIGLDEIMRKSQIAISNTKEPFTFYFVAALIYLTITVIVMFGQRYAERWAGRGVRSIDQ